MLVLLLAGCVSVPSNFKQPGVTVVAVMPRTANGMMPEFDILLRVSNPNRNALRIAGLSYQVWLAGSKVVDGVAVDLPRIEAYGEADVRLRARADLLGGLGVLARLMDDPQAAMEYEFIAEIDLGGLYPTVRVERSGQVDLD